MTLAELRAALDKLDHLPDDTLVVLAKDGEGNDYSPLSDINDAMYLPVTTWYGERFMPEAKRLAQDNPDDWTKAPENATPAVFLWPVN
jgi:predicted Abi (CAAX) family protease